MKNIIIILFVIGISSCKVQTKTGTISQTDLNTLVDSNNKSKAFNHNAFLDTFNQKLKNKIIQPLPYSEGEFLFRGSESNDLEPYIQAHFSTEELPPMPQKVNDFFVGEGIVDSITTYFPIDDFRQVTINKLHLYKRLQPLNKDIECVLFNTRVQDPGLSSLLVLITYNKTMKKVIAKKVISIIGFGQNNWRFDTGFKIDKNYNIKMVAYIREENILDKVEWKLEVLPNGQINTSNIHKTDIR